MKFDNNWNISGKTAKQTGKFKVASLGNFSEILHGDHTKIYARLSGELAQLSQYQSIVNKLKNSSGIVNFVVGEEWEPLVELLVKKAFPPFQNETYHAICKDQALPEDNHVSARAIWGADHISSDQKMKAAEDFNETLIGLPQLQTMDYLESIGVVHNVKLDRMSNEDKNNKIGLVDWIKTSPEWRAICVDESGKFDAQLGLNLLESFKSELKELNNSTLVKRTDSLKKELQKEYLARQSASSDTQMVSDEDFESMKNQYRALIRQKNLAYKELVKNSMIPVAKNANGKPQRDKTSGFLNHNPGLEINSLFKEYQRISKKMMSERNVATFSEKVREYENIIKNIFNSIKKQISGYQVLDPKTNFYQNKILSIINSAPPSTPDAPFSLVDYSLKNIGELVKLMTEYEDIVNNHGQVMIVSDVDFSSFNLEKDNGSEMKNSIYHALDNFSTHYNSMQEKGRSKGKNPPKKTILLVSKTPLAAVSQMTNVDLSKVLVNQEASNVIAKDLITSYLKDVLSAKRKINYVYKDKISRGEDVGNYKQVNLANLEAEEDVISKFAAYLQGMTVKKSFTILDNLIKNNIEKTTDGDSESVLDLNLDLEKVSKDLEKELSELPTTIGLKHRKPDLANFDNYMYDAETKWGQNVAQFKNIKEQLLATNFQIKSLQDNISKMTILLGNTKETTTKQQLTSQIGNLKEQLKNAQFQKNNMLTSMPHVFVLYGEPGTGKSLWADALASLFNFQTMQLNFSEARGKWLGDTEKQQRALISRIKEARNTVFLLDEMNKDVTMSNGGQGGSGDTTGGDSHDNKLVSQLLQFLQSSKNEFREKNVFIIVTTNQPNEIDTAFLERVDVSQKVEPPKTPEAYLRFFDTFLKDERQKSPNTPWFIHGSNSNAEAWDNTFKLIKSLDLNRLARKCVEKQLNFRFVGGVLREAVNKHAAFLISKENNEIGGTMDLIGVPLTNANLSRAADKFSSAKVGQGRADNTAYDRGFDEIALENRRAAAQFKEVTPKIITNPQTGNQETKMEFNKNFLKIMNGEYGNYDAIEADTSMQVERFTKLKSELEQVSNQLQSIQKGKPDNYWTDPHYKELEMKKSNISHEILRIKKLHPTIENNTSNPEKQIDDFQSLLSKDFKAKKTPIPEEQEVTKDESDESLESKDKLKKDTNLPKDKTENKSNTSKVIASSTDYYYDVIKGLKKSAQMEGIESIGGTNVEQIEPSGFYLYGGGDIMMLPIPGSKPHTFANKKRGI